MKITPNYHFFHPPSLPLWGDVIYGLSLTKLNITTYIFFNFRVDHKSEEDSKAYEAVKGSLSTKVEAVVKTLIKIRNDDPNAKALVFSTWNSVLDILESALVTNDIQFATLHVQGKFKRNLQKFKVSK